MAQDGGASFVFKERAFSAEELALVAEVLDEVRPLRFRLVQTTADRALLRGER